TNSLAANESHGGGIKAQQVAAFEQDFARTCTQGFIQPVDDGLGQHRLARAAAADHPQHLARGELERDPVKDKRRIRSAACSYGQVAYVEYRRLAHNSPP